MMGVTGNDGRGRETSRLHAGSTPATSTESGCWCKRKLRGGESWKPPYLPQSVELLRSAEGSRGVRFPDRSLRGKNTPQQPNKGAPAQLIFQPAHPTTEEARRML